MDEGEGKANETRAQTMPVYNMIFAVIVEKKFRQMYLFSIQ